MNRIAISIEQKENRRLLAEWLEQYYEVAIAKDGIWQGKSIPLLDEPFDLLILDGKALNSSWEWVRARKEAEQPVFLPVLLITFQTDVKLLTRHLWQTVDELIGKPIEKLELQAPVEMLLRSRRLSLQLQSSLEQERELKELKSQFVSMVSHEFRNPLNIISGFTNILEKRELSPEKRADFFRRIHTSINSMTALLDDVLEFGKVEACLVPASTVMLGIVPFCRQLIEEIEVSTGSDRAIVFECDDESSVVRVNEALLRQVLMNLLSNAIKYSTPEGKIWLKLHCEAEKITLQVQDEGIGIPPGDLVRLFESFYRASNVGNVPGTGLGLAIVKQAIEQSGGAIAVSSEVGVGTRFTVTLPLSRA